MSYEWIGPVVQGVGNMAAQASQGASEEERRKLLLRAIAEFDGIPPPELERLVAEELGPTAFDDIRADPEGMAAQYAALDALKGISDSGGHTLADDANLARARANAAGVASSGRHRISEEMAARGQLNSGATLAMQLAGNEGAANRASQESMDIAGQQQRRALDAILQRGKLGGDIRGQAHSEDARRAEARDMRERYNAQARTAAQRYNAGLGQQRFDNSLNLARGKTGQLGNLGTWYGDEGARNRQSIAGWGADASQALDRPKEYEEKDEYGNPKRRAY